MNHPSNLITAKNPAYITHLGAAYCGDALDLLTALPDNSINLVVTSPPFALLRKKEYGNEDQENYVKWLAGFGELVHKKLKENGSFVIDIGGAYQKGVPIRSLYNFKLVIHFVEVLGFNLAEEFYWYNPSKLPSPIEWVNKRKIRAKDSVNNVWWFSKSEYPKADITKVLAPYSDRMQKLIEDPAKYYNPAKRPSGHDISSAFGKDNGGSIPSNLLKIPNSESNSRYISNCKKVGVKTHPARFPSKLPKFFIDFLTDEDDIVLDIFAGSNTTGEMANKSNRRWLSFEISKDYCSSSVLRFLDDGISDKKLIGLHNKLLKGQRVDLKEHT